MILARFMMKYLVNGLAFFLLCSLISLSAKAQNFWVGTYEFEEDGGKTAGGTPIQVVHQIEVIKTDDGLIAIIQSAGYQTSVELVCKAREESNKLLIYFDYYGEDNIFEMYERGNLLLTLERKKDEILTFWGKFKPLVTKNEKSGKVYFRKVIATQK
jgi:hypothetical protein